MRAWEFVDSGQPLREVEKPIAAPMHGEMLIRVRAAGLCHSDVGFLDGTLTHILGHTPIVLGHEVAGEVVVLGPGVDSLQVGDRVVVATSPDNAPGVTRDGGFGEYVVAAADRTLPIPADVSWPQAAAATDAGRTSQHAVVVNGAVRPGDRVGVIGLGGLGLTGARIAVLAGAEVHAVEPREDVWPAALEAGVQSVVRDVAELAGADLDVVIDFAGHGSTVAGAIEAVRPRGRVVLVGLAHPEATIPLVSFIHKAVTMIGSSVGTMEDIAEVLRLMAAGDLRIATSSISFEDIPAGLEQLTAGTAAGRLVVEYLPA